MPPATNLVSTDQTAVLLQVVARTFRKTELHWHVFAGSVEAPDWAGPWIESLSAAAEARATAIADGTMPAVTNPDALADLHGLIAAATADGP